MIKFLKHGTMLDDAPWAWGNHWSDDMPASFAKDLADEMGPQFSEGGGGFGQINLVFGSSTRLRFSFVFGGSTGSKADKIALTLFNWNLYDLGISGISDEMAAEHPDLMGMVMVDASDQPFSYTLPAGAQAGTDIVIHESGTQTWFMSNTNANGDGGNGAPPTDPDSLTPAQKANELTLAFAEPTDSFELVFAFGVPKFSATGVSLAPWTGSAVGHMGHTVLFDGDRKSVV